MKIILIVLFLTFPYLFSQNKYLIYFTDKGSIPVESLNKSSVQYNKALSTLNQRSILRRKKVMDPNHIVTYEDIPLRDDYLNELQNLGIKIENKLKWFNAVSAHLSDDQRAKASTLPFVKNIEPVRIFKFIREKSLPKPGIRKITGGLGAADYGPSYEQLNLSDIPPVHLNGITGQGVIIGILDDGFLWKEHESLIDKNVLAEYNFVFHVVSTAPQPGDDPSSGDHGTKVFSIIGGYKDSSIIGSAFNASFILAKTEDDRSESHIEEDNYAAALEWMEGMGVDVTTSSLGYNIFDDTTYSYTYQNMDGKTTICAKACELAFQRGVLVFNAAGNEGEDSWYYIITPADGLHVIAVGAVDASNTLASFSSHGPTSDGRIKPDVVAQGVLDFGAAVDQGFNSYSLGDGTSFSTPIASGIGALLLSAFPYLTNVQARNIILETAGNSNHPDNNIGYGLISAKNAVSYPNFSDSSGILTINKIFFSPHGITNAVIHYSTNSSNFESANLLYDGKIKYSFVVPPIPNVQDVQFYFTYNDSLNNNFREPATELYDFNYAQLDISTSVNQTNNNSSDILSGNYPNPFPTPSSPFTKINFTAQGGEIAKLVILNAIGQTVKVLFNAPAAAGINTVTWDGKSGKGIKCASGVYYYILTLNGKSYGKKMVLIK